MPVTTPSNSSKEVLSCDHVFIHTLTHISGLCLQLDDVIQRLQCSGQVDADPGTAAALLKGDMRCPRCATLLPNIPAVKRHCLACLAVQPAGGALPGRAGGE